MQLGMSGNKITTDPESLRKLLDHACYGSAIKVKKHIAAENQIYVGEICGKVRERVLEQIHLVERHHGMKTRIERPTIPVLMKITSSEILIERTQRVLSVNSAPGSCNGVFIDVCPNNDNIPIAAGAEQLMHENR